MAHDFLPHLLQKIISPNDKLYKKQTNLFLAEINWCHS